MKTKLLVSEFLVYVMLTISALVPRVWHLTNTWNDDVASGGDAVEYEDLAWSIVSTGSFQYSVDDALRHGPGGTPTALRTPGFPAFIAGVYLLFGRNVAAVRCAQVLLSVASVLFLYAACRNSFGRAVGVVAASCWAIWPTSILAYWSSDSYYSEPFAVALLLLSIWALSCVRGPAGSALSGILLGFALLTRSHLLPMVPILGLSAWIWRRRLGRSAVRLSIVAMLAIVPTGAWALRNYLVLGALSPSTQGGNALWLGNNAEARGSAPADWQGRPEARRLVAEHPELPFASETVKSRIYSQDAVRGIRARGWRHFLWLETRKAILFLYPGDATSGYLWWFVPILLLSVPGTVLAWRQSFGEQTLFLVAMVASSVVTTLVYFHEARYRYLAEPALVVFASMTAASLWRGELRRGLALRRESDS